MTRWVTAVLDWRYEDIMRCAHSNAPDAAEYFERDALAAARLGNIQSLRERYRHLADFIHAPTIGQRGRYSRHRDPTWIDIAVEDSAFVKKVWREVYGRRKRRRDEGASAETFVATYHKDIGHRVTERAITARAKNYRPLLADDDNRARRAAIRFS